MVICACSAAIALNRQPTRMKGEKNRLRNRARYALDSRHRAHSRWFPSVGELRGGKSVQMDGVASISLPPPLPIAVAAHAEAALRAPIVVCKITNRLMCCINCSKGKRRTTVDRCPRSHGPAHPSRVNAFPRLHVLVAGASAIAPAASQQVQRPSEGGMRTIALVDYVKMHFDFVDK